MTTPTSPSSRSEALASGFRLAYARPVHLHEKSAFDLHEELFVGDRLHDRPPTLAEVQFFCQEENSLYGLAGKLRNARPRRTREYQLMIQRYEPLLLSEYGMEAEALRRICLDNFTELERVAWSRNAEDDESWIIGEEVGAAHFVRVAAKCGISLHVF